METHPLRSVKLAHITRSSQKFLPDFFANCLNIAAIYCKNAIEKMQDMIQRLRKATRENTTLDERVRRSIEWDLIEIITDQKPEDDDEEGARGAERPRRQKARQGRRSHQGIVANLLCVARP
jgi:hypothetical protein